LFAFSELVSSNRVPALSGKFNVLFVFVEGGSMVNVAAPEAVPLIFIELI
jgi:hypothetical protein